MLIINNSINKSRFDNFQKFGTFEKIVLVEYTTKKGVFKEYLLNNVYDIVKRNKSIKFIAFKNAITIEKEKESFFIEFAKNKKTFENIFLNLDKLNFE